MLNSQYTVCLPCGALNILKLKGSEHSCLCLYLHCTRASCIPYMCKDYIEHICKWSNTKLLNYAHFWPFHQVAKIFLCMSYDSVLLCTFRYYIKTLLPTYVHILSDLVRNLSTSSLSSSVKVTATSKTGMSKHLWL